MKKIYIDFGAGWEDTLYIKKGNKTYINLGYKGDASKIKIKNF